MVLGLYGFLWGRGHGRGLQIWRKKRAPYCKVGALSVWGSFIGGTRVEIQGSFMLKVNKRRSLSGNGYEPAEDWRRMTLYNHSTTTYHGTTSLCECPPPPHTQWQGFIVPREMSLLTSRTCSVFFTCEKYSPETTLRTRHRNHGNTMNGDSYNNFKDWHFCITKLKVIHNLLDLPGDNNKWCWVCLGFYGGGGVAGVCKFEEEKKGTILWVASAQWIWKRR